MTAAEEVEEEDVVDVTVEEEAVVAVEDAMVDEEVVVVDVGVWPVAPR